MLKTIDLFAGAGGLSYGFESTGEFLIVVCEQRIIKMLEKHILKIIKDVMISD
ncbi:MAG: DNA cytosine methyltransferase [Mediterraneibacter gnavus]